MVCWARVMVGENFVADGSNEIGEDSGVTSFHGVCEAGKGKERGCVGACDGSLWTRLIARNNEDAVMETCQGCDRVEAR